MIYFHRFPLVLFTCSKKCTMIWTIMIGLKSVFLQLMQFVIHLYFWCNIQSYQSNINQSLCICECNVVSTTQLQAIFHHMGAHWFTFFFTMIGHFKKDLWKPNYASDLIASPRVWFIIAVWTFYPISPNIRNDNRRIFFKDFISSL